MLLEKLQWVQHKGENNTLCAITSVDVSQDGKRFATAGGDGRVKVWSTEGLLAADKASPDVATGGANGVHAVNGQKSAVQKPLAILTQHTLGVNCVRWSHNSRYLASAADDKYIFVWRLQPGQVSAIKSESFLKFKLSQPYFSREQAPAGGEFGTGATAENWSRCLGLQGHGMDVVDCAWSPDDTLLASVSLDNRVIIWRVAPAPGSAPLALGALVAPLKVLDGHQGFAKGVCWDPVGRYLASAGDDKTLVVRRAGGDWGVEARITEQFSAKGHTLFRRLSWSPDGASLCATNARARGKPVHTAAIIERGKWTEWLDLVGHSASTSISRFSNNIFSADSSKYCVLAVGSTDGVVSVWKSPSDFGWGGEGQMLLIASHDGTVALARFTEAEVGKAVPDEERRQVLRTKYGGAVGTLALGAAAIPETPYQLAVAQARSTDLQQIPPQIARPATNGGASTGTLGPRPPQLQQQQQQQRLAGGKRRITPMIVTAAPAHVEHGNGGGGGGDDWGASQSQEHASTCRVTGRSLQRRLCVEPRDPSLVNNNKEFSCAIISAGWFTMQYTLCIHHLTTQTAGCKRQVTRGGGGGAAAAWRDYVAGKVTACCGNTMLSAVGCTDGSVYLYDRAGVRAAVPFVLEGAVAHLECNESPSPQPPAPAQAPPPPRCDHLLAITSEGVVTAWNVTDMSRTVTGTLGAVLRTMAPATAQQRRSKRQRVAEGEDAKAAKEGGSAAAAVPYPRIVRLQTWLRVADGRHALSSFHTSLATSTSSLAAPSTSSADAALDLQPGAVVERLQASVRRGARVTASGISSVATADIMPLLTTLPGEAAAGGALQHSVTRAHLEESLNCALALSSRLEFERVLGLYARHLAAPGRVDELRIRSLCDRLSAPAADASQTSTSTERAGVPLLGLRLGPGFEVLGAPRQQLLERIVLPALSSNSAVQRLVQEYA
ncbi:WD40-repeat-containing domain protein, partial [Tribonema minus]